MIRWVPTVALAYLALGAAFSWGFPAPAVVLLAGLAAVWVPR